MPRRRRQIKSGIGERDYIGGLCATGANAKNRSTVSISDGSRDKVQMEARAVRQSAVRKSRSIAKCLFKRSQCRFGSGQGPPPVRSRRFGRIARVDCLWEMSSIFLVEHRRGDA
jgi:hypothetical protein